MITGILSIIILILTFLCLWLVNKRNSDAVIYKGKEQICLMIIEAQDREKEELNELLDLYIKEQFKK